MRHVQLESVAYRQDIMVFTKPRNLATGVMSPDFMDWFEQLPYHSVIYISGDVCCIMHQTFLKPQQLQTFAAEIPQIIRFVLRSGALEKKL